MAWIACWSGANDIMRLHRLTETTRERVDFELDGRPASALAGDTVLTAVLTQHYRLRITEFDATPRAGFCMMWACQDCWIELAGGGRIRACSTMLSPGMCLLTRPARNTAAAVPGATDA